MATTINGYDMSMKWGTLFIPTGKFPVIANRVFKTLEEAQNYLAYNQADASAIPGLILSVIEDPTADNNGAYLVTGTDGNLELSKLADVEGASNDSEITVSKVGDNYNITQGGKLIGTINIPKDMVVSSGQVITGSDGQKYLELTLANAPEGSNKVQIAVKDLVDVYTAGAGATQVQISIADNVITATLVDGGVTTAKLANLAVTTAKIANSAVTAVKLSAEARALFDTAGTANAVKTTIIGSNTDSVDADTINGLRNRIDGLTISTNDRLGWYTIN